MAFRRSDECTLPRRRLTLLHLATCASGTDLTPYDLARLSRGRFSRKTIVREIQRGKLAADIDRRGRTVVHWIEFKEARRYFILRGLIASA